MENDHRQIYNSFIFNLSATNFMFIFTCIVVMICMLNVCEIYVCEFSTLSAVFVSITVVPFLERNLPKGTVVLVK